MILYIYSANGLKAPSLSVTLKFYVMFLSGFYFLFPMHIILFYHINKLLGSFQTSLNLRNVENQNWFNEVTLSLCFYVSTEPLDSTES